MDSIQHISQESDLNAMSTVLAYLYSIIGVLLMHTDGHVLHNATISCVLSSLVNDL